MTDAVLVEIGICVMKLILFVGVAAAAASSLIYFIEKRKD